MKHLLRSLVVLALAVVPVAAGPVTSGGYQSSGNGQYAVAIATNAVTTLTVPVGTAGAEICVETAGIRYTDDGSTPTSSVGIPVVPASSTLPTCFQYFGPLNKMKIIGISGSPTIDVSYYKTTN
jgi:hypothetical protein